MVLTLACANDKRSSHRTRRCRCGARCHLPHVLCPLGEGAVPELDDEPPDGLAHLLEADDADGLDARGGRGSDGGGPCGLVDKALGADVLADGLDELLGMVACDAEELPALLEGIERGVHGCRLLLTNRLRASLHHSRLQILQATVGRGGGGGGEAGAVVAATA